jgi:diguanylate cyclase (GGDEF)-like protein/PAS domain S-box-containing protein
LALFVNAAICAIIGLALLMVWRRNPRQRFTRYVGLAHLMVMLGAPSYLASLQADPGLHWAGLAVLVGSTVAYTTLVMLGVAWLAGRALDGGRQMAVFSAVLGVNGLALWLGGQRTAWAGSALLNTAVGLTSLVWLWRGGGSGWRAERLVGLLLTLLGLNQFNYVVSADQGLQLQTHLSSVMRVALGMALVYAAWQRAMVESGRMRARFELLTERSHQGILIFDTGGVMYANPAALTIYGLKRAQDLNVGLMSEAIPPGQRDEIVGLVRGVLQGERSEARYQGPRQRGDGSLRWLTVNLFRTEWDGRPAVQALVTDDTDRHESAQALLQQAMYDELTGLPNRTALIQTLRERSYAGGGGEPFVLMLLDIDRFQLFNEAHGHAMGDEVILALAKGLLAVMSPGQIVMRPGEDEFAVLSAPGGDEATAQAMAEAVRKLLSGPLEVASREFFVDVSMGIALFPDTAGSAEALWRAANAAMHVAKRTPGTSHALAQPDFQRGASTILEQEQALRAGILNAEFHLVYQPKVGAHDTELASFEALARWERPGVGLVSPVEFIAAAERTGLIGELGHFFLREACQQIASWQADFQHCVPVAVNVSPLQLLDAEFPQLVAHVLDDTGVPPELLTLEITESSAVQNLEQTIAQISQLREMGVHVAMDDFGAGFSSLNMLRSLPLQAVKIDRGLVDPLPAPEAVAVVRAICQLAQALGLKVVAEGVETEGQAQAAREAGCTELQGYLYAKPLGRQEAGRWLMLQARQLQSVTGQAVAG